MDKKKINKTVKDSVCHVHKTVGYTALSNCFVRSTNIHCPAIGLLGKVMSLPPNWNFTMAGLEAICDDGITVIETALAELEEYGYVKKTIQMPNESPTGRIRYIYDFYEYSEKDDSLPKYDLVMETFTADNATLNRVKKDSNFTLISNKLLQNREIKLKLLGFLLKVLSLPNNWRFSMKGLKAICKEGMTAVRSAVGKLIDMGYLVRTKLLPSESIHHTYEYVYEFFEKALSKEEAQEREAETRRKAADVCREVNDQNSGKMTSATAEKQEVENLYVDSLSAEPLLTENHGQYNTKEKIKNNQLLSYESSIIPSAPKREIFNKKSVKNSDDGMMEIYSEEEIEDYTDLVRQNIGYWDLGEWLCNDDRDGYGEADEIVGFIVDEICSTAPFGRIKGEMRSREIIRSVMLKANIFMVENAILQMAKVDEIKDFRKYFISTLYNEVLQYNFRENCESRSADYAVRRDFGYAFA